MTNQRPSSPCLASPPQPPSAGAPHAEVRVAVSAAQRKVAGRPLRRDLSLIP
ncbi:unnamed protein product [Spirodela intermedia]|uniref:Uncharacterized protein n=1 Tax=Spirodela intermedia TaxID=51605 RepID=A0ABN7EAJ2_SPIIN|nr:unnamed protein product [Spirodela intermedia]